jgi:hypothetical protein
MKLTQEQVLGIFRHGLTFVGGILITKGLIDEAMVSEITGSVISLVGLIWSVVSKKTA